MVSPRHHVDSFLHDWIVGVVHRVVYQNLVGALSRLPLHTVHEATAEDDDLVTEDHARVPVSANHAVDGVVFEVLPVGLVLARHQSGDLIVALVVLTSDQIAIIVHAAKCGVLARCWDPALDIQRSNLSKE